MHAGLAAGMVLAVALASGAALWPRPAAASATATESVAAPGAGVIEDLARGLLAALDEAARADAVLALELTSSMLLDRASSRDPLGRRGLPITRVPAGALGLVERLLACAGRRHDAGGLRGLHVAWAGPLAERGPFYVRLHADAFAVEWVHFAGGALHTRRLDFARAKLSDWQWPMVVQRLAR